MIQHGAQGSINSRIRRHRGDERKSQFGSWLGVPSPKRLRDRGKGRQAEGYANSGDGGRSESHVWGSKSGQNPENHGNSSAEDSQSENEGISITPAQDHNGCGKAEVKANFNKFPKRTSEGDLNMEGGAFKRSNMASNGNFAESDGMGDQSGGKESSDVEAQFVRFQESLKFTKRTNEVEAP